MVDARKVFPVAEREDHFDLLVLSHLKLHLALKHIFFVFGNSGNHHVLHFLNESIINVFLVFYLPVTFFLFLGHGCSVFQEPLEPLDGFFLLFRNLELINLEPVVVDFAARLPLIPKIHKISRPTSPHI